MVKNVYIYEIIAAKSKTNGALEFGWLTENGLRGSIQQAVVYPTEIIIESSEETVCLKAISPEVVKRIKLGADLLILNLAGDSVEKIKTVFSNETQ